MQTIRKTFISNPIGGVVSRSATLLFHDFIACFVLLKLLRHDIFLEQFSIFQKTNNMTNIYIRLYTCKLLWLVVISFFIYAYNKYDVDNSRTGKLFAMCAVADESNQNSINNALKEAEKDDKENKVIFSIHPGRYRVDLVDGITRSSTILHIFRDGIENKDLSDTSLSNTTCPSFGTDDSFYEYNSIPVTKKAFETTKNFKMKIMRHVDLYIDFEKVDMSLANWELDSVNFTHSRNIDKCDLTNAQLENCMFFGGDIGGSDSPTNTNPISFQQFVKTANYQYQELPCMYFLSMDLTNWQFGDMVDKDISKLKFGNCRYHGELLDGEGMTPEYFAEIDRRVAEKAAPKKEKTTEKTE
ncbi:MAG: hypothetical protein ACRC2T_12885 [Thermoguttaceae bacterium]